MAVIFSPTKFHDWIFQTFRNVRRYINANTIIPKCKKKLRLEKNVRESYVNTIFHYQFFADFFYAK